MKKYLTYTAIFIIGTFFLIILAGMYKFNYLANKEGYDVDGNRIKMHESWDKNLDGINDCEAEGSCDHTIDYTKERKY